MATPARSLPGSRGALQTRIAARRTPALFAETAEAREQFWEFFGARIRTRNTRLAYVTATFRFADWCEVRGARPRDRPRVSSPQQSQARGPISWPCPAFSRQAGWTESS